MEGNLEDVQKEITWDDLNVFKKRKKRKKVEDFTQEEVILKESREKQLFVAAERDRIAYFRQYHRAALVIQKAWKMFKFKTKGILKNARDAVRKKRLDAGELEWKQQIAACTIQLAWRKYARRKLLERVNSTGDFALNMWDPELMALKQKYNLYQIYGEQLYVPSWHPTRHVSTKPSWMPQQPSPAALSFNFARDQYTQPLTICAQDYMYYQKRSSDIHYSYIEELDQQIRDGLVELQLPIKTDGATHYSYNMT